MRTAVVTALTAVLLLAPAGIASAGQGPDWVSSDNVEYLGSIKDDVGLTTGARIVGNRLFVTSGKNISIYDISDPAAPKRLGSMTMNTAWENEEVPTNGKVLAFASDFYSAVPSCVGQLEVTGCVQFFDVRDPSNIREIGAVPVANHTVECVLDCQWFYGSSGTIIDARGILHGKAPTVAGNWITELRSQGVDSRSCHHMREVRPGVLLTACRPFSVISVRAEDGGSPARPKVLYTGQSNAFVHSARWPRGGTDKFLMTGGETNFTGRCDGENGEFRVYSAENVNARRSREFEGPIATKQPAGNGTYADGKPVANHLGCSVHWFQEHPTFRNGGLVALSEYEGGVRFLQIHNNGKITEQGYFLPLGGSSSSPKWAPTGNVVYSLDYDRGIDIIRWKGHNYVPGRTASGMTRKGGPPGFTALRRRGTEGTTLPPAPTAEQLASRKRLAERMRAEGWTPGLCREAVSDDHKSTAGQALTSLLLR